jgi:hypothetical protein
MLALSEDIITSTTWLITAWCAEFIAFSAVVIRIGIW